jgi:transcriptional regulator with XRE-family HTH domain
MNDDPSQATLDRAKLRRRRIAAGLSQTALAERAGVSGATVSYIESGDRNARPATLLAFAKALACETTDLMPDEAATPADARVGA